MQSGSRMIHGDHLATVDVMGATMNGADATIGDEFCHRNAPKCDNHLWVKQFDLFIQVALTGSELFGQWIAVVGWAAFDHIGDKDLVALHPGCL